ncbi:putative Bax inhibitor [Clavispora lusitaniae]|uniref:Bax inhibitor n=1 Tax=Clavispora lusitaniae TaxID=36911 RepID=A0ACD0WMT7_CLALS|nr:putative Bax inhibitor [Clavispora lusitaniae]QFZ34209.1 putative Bax inhibitor [Clavispora lusitaniae]QFZ39893.1 putative Bax inhibitor [Clavispora lusitaniae]QFZ45575.1 putative Bax inhibitor [Clavispora lusitaniae]QFZ51239.1 putative Bax inhibitor [Clavispora lusitaniae]
MWDCIYIYLYIYISHDPSPCFVPCHIMSYTQIPQSPPAYGETDAPRTSGDNIPDDFKYSANVASCELPIRQMFLRKVYALLSIQVLLTVIVGYVIRSNSAIQNWCMNNMWLYIVSIVGVFGFMIATYWKARSYPTNLILLTGFTVCEAYGLGLACSFVKSGILSQALLITFAIFMGLTLFAFQTKYDFTSWQGVLGMALWALIAWGFISMFFPIETKGVAMVYSGIGAIVFSGYVVVDTQIIMKTATLDDEIVASVTLYLDIINLFLFVLRFLQSRDD